MVVGRGDGPGLKGRERGRGSQRALQASSCRPRLGIQGMSEETHPFLHVPGLLHVLCPGPVVSNRFTTKGRDTVERAKTRAKKVISS